MLQAMLGHEDQAQQALDAAKKISEAALPKDQPPPDSLLALNLAVAAVVHRERGQNADALADAEKALLSAEKALGGEHPYVAAILDNLMAANLGQAHYAAAYARGSRATHSIEKLSGTGPLAIRAAGAGPPLLGHEPKRAGQAGHGPRQLPRGRQILPEALEILQATVDPKSSWLGEVQYTQGRLEIARDAPYAARPHFEEAQKIWQSQGSDYPPSISVLGDLASLDDTSSRIISGIARAKQAVESADRVYGSEHPELSRLLCILAVLQRQKKDYAAAADCLHRAVEIREKTLSAAHPDLAATLDLLASVLRKMDPPQNDQAAELEARAKDIRAKHVEEDRLK